MTPEELQELERLRNTVTSLQHALRNAGVDHPRYSNLEDLEADARDVQQGLAASRAVPMLVPSGLLNPEWVSAPLIAEENTDG